MGLIIGVDPGETTGLCVLRDGEFVEGREVKEYQEISVFILMYSPGVIVIEDYIISRLPSRPKQPLKIIGMIEYFGLLNGWPVVVQSPSVLDRMLRRVEGMHPSKHVRSACAHALYYHLTNL